MLKYIILIVLFAFVATQSVFAKDSYCPSDLTKNPPSEHVSLYFHINASNYPINGSIVLNAAIVNSGDNPVYVYDWISWGYGGGLVIRIRDEHGNEVAPVLRDDTMLPPPRNVNDPNIFVRLRDHGDFFGTQRRMKVADLVKFPGKYTLQIEYRSPLSCKFVGEQIRNLPALWHEDKSIFSTRVPLEVTSTPRGSRGRHHP